MRNTGVAIKLLGGAVAFCALAFAPLPEASAGCGDYLTMGHEIDAKHGGDPMKPGAAPCRGPNCSRRQSPMRPPTSDFRVPPPVAKAVSHDFELAGAKLSRSAFERQSDSKPITGFESSILRPPRST